MIWRFRRWWLEIWVPRDAKDASTIEGKRMLELARQLEKERYRVKLDDVEKLRKIASQKELVEGPIPGWLFNLRVILEAREVFREPAWLVGTEKWVGVVGKSGTILLETWGEVPSILDPSEYWSWKDLRRQLAK